MSAEPLATRGRDRRKNAIADPELGFDITEESRPDAAAQVKALARLLREAAPTK